MNSRECLVTFFNGIILLLDDKLEDAAYSPSSGGFDLPPGVSTE